jgi:hypothetical protein
VWFSRIGEEERPLLSCLQLRSIEASGIEIGAHTASHPALDTLPLARNEVVRSKQMLEEQLRGEIKTFAYGVREVVLGAGFTSACAVRYAMSSIHDDHFALARHTGRRGTSIQQFSTLLSGRSPRVYYRLRSSA